MIVFGSYDDESVATRDGRRELRVLHLLAGIIEFQRKLAHIDQLRLYASALLCLLKNKARDVLALSPPPGSSKDNWNKEWPLHLR